MKTITFLMKVRPADQNLVAQLLSGCSDISQKALSINDVLRLN